MRTMKVQWRRCKLQPEATLSLPKRPPLTAPHYCHQDPCYLHPRIAAAQDALPPRRHHSHCTITAAQDATCTTPPCFAAAQDAPTWTALLLPLLLLQITPLALHYCCCTRRPYLDCTTILPPRRQAPLAPHYCHQDATYTALRH